MVCLLARGATLAGLLRKIEYPRAQRLWRQRGRREDMGWQTIDYYAARIKESLDTSSYMHRNSYSWRSHLRFIDVTMLTYADNKIPSPDTWQTKCWHGQTIDEVEEGKMIDTPRKREMRFPQTD